MLPEDDDEQVTCLKSFLEQENRLLHEAPMAVLEREESGAEDEQDPSEGCEAKYAIPSSMKLRTKFSRNWMVPSRTWSLSRSGRSRKGQWMVSGQNLTIMPEETMRQLVHECCSHAGSEKFSFMVLVCVCVCVCVCLRHELDKKKHTHTHGLSHIHIHSHTDTHKHLHSATHTHTQVKSIARILPFGISNQLYQYTTLYIH